MVIVAALVAGLVTSPPASGVSVDASEPSEQRDDPASPPGDDGDRSSPRDDDLDPSGSRKEEVDPSSPPPDVSEPVPSVGAESPALAETSRVSAGAVARKPRGEVLISAAAPPRPLDADERPVHGEARLGVGFGAVMQDAIAVLHPSIELDLSELAPVWLRVGAPIRLRMVDRAPDQSGVVRARDWDEVGDGIAVLEKVHYADQFVVGQRARAAVGVDVGRLTNTGLGHASLLRGYDNSLDLDRRRTGAHAVTSIAGDLVAKRAQLDAAAVVADLAGSQILAARVAGRWAGAGLGFSAVGDPTAPRSIASPAGAPDRFARRDRNGTLQTDGARGVAGLALDVSYEATDRWRWRVEPYVDLVLMPGLAKGIHIGSDAEVVLGRRRRSRLGGTAELTVGDRSYAPAYFDVFYTAERWQTPMLATADDRPMDLAGTAMPKYAFVRDANLFGAGGYGALRYRHDAGAFAEASYFARPGPRGHTFSLRVGTELRVVTLSALLAHRGRHGFEPQRAGSLAAIDLRVPIITYVDVFAALGWTFAIRADTLPPAIGEPAGLVSGAGFFVAGVGGRVPW